LKGSRDYERSVVCRGGALPAASGPGRAADGDAWASVTARASDPDITA
jgi:hypothetical protein